MEIISLISFDIVNVIIGSPNVLKYFNSFFFMNYLMGWYEIKITFFSNDNKTVNLLSNRKFQILTRYHSFQTLIFIYLLLYSVNNMF